MITFMESKEELIAANGEGLDSQLWHACAGSLVQIPPVNSKVYYFPQGHSEHASGIVDFSSCPRFPAYIPCRVSAIKFMADGETDEVFAKIRFIPINVNVGEFDDDDDAAAVGLNGSENQDKPTSFAKTLTQSDANNGGGFSVPRYCAETIFPPLDYGADPPVQTILAKDVHGQTWRFRHIYRGTPRRHLLTTGWSSFVNQKKLCAGDSIVFVRAENDDLCLGIRRAKTGIGGGPEISTGWNSAAGNSGVQCGDLQGFMTDDRGNIGRKSGRVKVEDVIEAATLAARGQPFDVVYYPQSTAPEFFVEVSQVKAAMRIRWDMGMRFKMAFETEDSSRISWFMGTISSVQVADPTRWSDSPWKLLQVTWDEPDLLRNVKQVNPWSVELVSNIQGIPVSSFSPPPMKKIRLQNHHQEFPLDGHIMLPPFSSYQFLRPNNPFGYLPTNISPAGMQGARHAQYDFSLPPHYPTERPSGFAHHDIIHPPTIPLNPVVPRPKCNENISSLLTMGNSTQEFAEPADTKASTPAFQLFGKPILTEQQISAISSHTGNSSSDKLENTSDGSTPALNHNGEVLGLETGHCKVFIETDDVGRTLDLSLLTSYEELYIKLQHLFSIEVSEMKHIVYRDAMGAVRQLGDEPFSDLSRTARRLMIVGHSSSGNMEA